MSWDPRAGANQVRPSSRVRPNSRPRLCPAWGSQLTQVISEFNYSYYNISHTFLSLKLYLEALNPWISTKNWCRKVIWRGWVTQSKYCLDTGLSNPNLSMPLGCLRQCIVKIWGLEATQRQLKCYNVQFGKNALDWQWIWWNIYDYSCKAIQYLQKCSIWTLK